MTRERIRPSGSQSIREGSWRLCVLFSFFLHTNLISAQIENSQIGSATPSLEGIPTYAIEGRSELDREKVFAEETFQYTLTLSWEGNQTWVSLDPPEIDWPDGIEPIDVRIKAVSRTGAAGPIGEKSFIYDLKASQIGTHQIPKVEVEILFNDHSTQKVEILGKVVGVENRPPPAGEKVAEEIKENALLVGGVFALVLAAVIFWVLTRRKISTGNGEQPDPWIPLEGNLEKCDALQKAGQAREFYGNLEATLGAACALCQGKPNSQLRGFPLIEKMEPGLQQEYKILIGEIEERKYRPDQPRPEEMQRTYKQARSVLSFLKNNFHEKGS